MAIEVPPEVWERGTGKGMMQGEGTIFRPSYYDRENRIVSMKFWPLIRPRRAEETSWGWVHLLRRARATGIEIREPSRILPADLLDVLPDLVDAKAEFEPRTPAVGPASHYDRGTGIVLMRTEIVDDEMTRSEPSPWGGTIRAQEDDRIVGLAIREAQTLLPPGLLGWLPRPGQGPP